MNDNRDIFFKSHIDSFNINVSLRKFIEKNEVIQIDFWFLANAICVLSEI